jgi:hypothetical protein
MGVRGFVRSLKPGNDRALAAQLRQEREEKARKAREKREARDERDRKERARRHKETLARKGSGARLF